MKLYIPARLLFTLALIALLLLPAQLGAAEQFAPDACSLQGAVLTRVSQPLPEMRLVLRDGKKEFKEIIPSNAVLSKVKNGYASQWKDSSGKTGYKCQAVKTGHMVRWTLNVQNNSAEDLWLDIQLQAGLNSRTPSFWDGRDLHKDMTAKFVRTAFASTFPMTCAWDSGSGLAIGMDPQQIVSWLEEGCDPKTGIFWQGTRMVVWAGKSESVSFAAMPFNPSYGYFSALQVFYDAFPLSMSAWPGTDSRLKGGYDGGVVNHEIKSRYLEPEYSTQEFARRSFTDWDWFFRPAKYNFFIMDKPEYWEGDDKPYTAPAGVFGVDPDGWKGGSEREYNIARNRYLTERGESKGIASIYYILSHGDKPLVEKYNWTDNNAYEKEDNRDGFPTVGDWGGLPGRGSRRLFPGAGLPAEAIKKDMVEVLKTYPVRGFAWDSNRVDALFRQPQLIRECPRPAFDEKGAFVHDSVGYAMIIDYVHGLKLSDGATAGMASNLGPPRQSYLISLRADTTISEMLVVHLINDIKGFEHDRIMRGRRSKSQLSGMWRDPIGNSLNWNDMSPLEIRDALRVLHSQFLLLCLKLGIYPEPDSCLGYEKTMRHLPAIDAATRAGWEPVCAMKGPEDLWLSRFGKGGDTILTLGNPFDGREVPAADITLESEYTGLSGCVLTEFFGQPLNCKVGKDITVFPVELAEGDALVYRAAGVVDAPACLLTAAEYRADRTIYNWKSLDALKSRCAAFVP
ncbi:MAG: hypothetical protein PHT33_07885, partial [bacterium]|nr:hypothetical protein [bacterium]